MEETFDVKVMKKTKNIKKNCSYCYFQFKLNEHFIKTSYLKNDRYDYFHPKCLIRLLNKRKEYYSNGLDKWLELERKSFPLMQRFIPQIVAEEI